MLPLPPALLMRVVPRRSCLLPALGRGLMGFVGFQLFSVCTSQGRNHFTFTANVSSVWLIPRHKYNHLGGTSEAGSNKKHGCFEPKPSSLRSRDNQKDWLSSLVKRTELTSRWAAQVGTSACTVMGGKGCQRAGGGSTWPTRLVAEVCCLHCSVGTASVSGESGGC